MRHRSLLIAITFSAAAGYGISQWRDQVIVRRPLLPINFDHHDHGAVKCATCHHNFFDATGRDSCYFCHKIRPVLARRIEADFHTFCRDCHVQIVQQGIKSGPLRRCGACHDDPTGVLVGHEKTVPP